MRDQSILRRFGTLVHPKWTARVKRVDRSLEVIWNPILRRWGIIKAGPPDSVLEFGGYRFTGWLFIASVEHADGSLREIDGQVVHELSRSGEFAMRYPNRTARLRRMRARAKAAKAAVDDADHKAYLDMWDNCVRELWKPAYADKRTFGPGTFRAGSHIKPYGVTR